LLVKHLTAAKTVQRALLENMFET